MARRAPTEAKRRVWRLLRDRRLNGLKFRRQVPIGPYSVDFLCVSARLIVEADGPQHSESVRDDRHDAYLARQGWVVLRFWNHNILRHRERILDTIPARVGLPWRRGPHPAALARGHLLPEGEGRPWSRSAT